MHIAILGATSQIAKDLILSFSAEDETTTLQLFARRPNDVNRWLGDVGLAGRYQVDDFSEFSHQHFDVVINFVGVGNPAQAARMGKEVFEVTLRYDDLVLDYLKKNPECKYIFLSSGAAYGSNFSEPATEETPSIFPVNSLGPQDWYGVAKLYAESRHRAHSELSIIDIRVFSYFSCNQNLYASFLIGDIVRAIKNESTFETSSENIKRDYLNPFDFYKLITCCLSSDFYNSVIDAYTLASIDKFSLLKAMQEKYNLHYVIVDGLVGSKIGHKINYYSLNRAAHKLGYQPIKTSLEGILIESDRLLLKQY